MGVRAVMRSGGAGIARRFRVVAVVWLGALGLAAAEEPRRAMPKWVPMTPVDPPPASTQWLSENGDRNLAQGGLPRPDTQNAGAIPRFRTAAPWGPLPVRTQTPVMPGSIVQTPQFSGQGPLSMPSATGASVAASGTLGDPSLARRLADASLAGPLAGVGPRPSARQAFGEPAIDAAPRISSSAARRASAAVHSRPRPLVVDVAPPSAFPTATLPTAADPPAGLQSQQGSPERVASLPERRAVDRIVAPVSDVETSSVRRTVPRSPLARPALWQPETSSRPAVKEQADFETGG